MPRRARTSRWSSVHPRTGGEHLGKFRERIFPFGSSPHGRGTYGRDQHLGPQRRFIPARAGNISSRRRRRTEASVHPRTGGEHRLVQVYLPRCDGSSPHGRGTSSTSQGPGQMQRFIPARAGNIRCRISFFTHFPVHPRTGGEHSRCRPSASMQSGSSPHGRGT